MADHVKTIAVLTSGGDAPGMNAAIRAVVRTAIARGLKVKGIERGYAGLLNEEIIDMEAKDVSDIIQRGGTILGTARCEEFKDPEVQKRGAEICRKHGIEGLVVIGGDGSYRGAQALARNGINAIGIPGTIDLDISCTEYTIGFDTAMNTAMELMDKLRDTSQSHDRCSVVEVMGRNAGHIAVNTGIGCGATDIITVEAPYDLDVIAKSMLEKKAKGKQYFVVVVSEGVGHTEEIAKVLQEKTQIETRATILGHVQRGGSPTLRDRVEATRMGYYAVELLEQGIGNRVVGIKDSKIVDYDIQEALAMKKTYDSHLHKIAEEIAF